MRNIKYLNRNKASVERAYSDKVNLFRSLMDVVLALERVGVALLILDSLDLNGCVEKFVLAAEHVRDLSQSL